VLAIVAALQCIDVVSAVDLDPAFSHHAVLQAGVRHPVTGSGAPGERVSVSFAAQVAKTTVDADGRWAAWLLPLQPSSTPGRLVADGSETGRATADDVVVGQVWVCAGQSNMALSLERAWHGPDAAEDASTLTGLRLRHFRSNVPLGAVAWSAEQCAALTPRSFFEAAPWTRADTESSAAFSAVGHFFGRTLGYELETPVGLISVAVGGTPTESWVPLRSILADSTLAPLAEDFPSSPLAHPFISDRAARHLAAHAPDDHRAAIPNHPFRPGFMYEAAIAPLAGLPVAGVLWYQGESNAHDAAQHERLLRRLTRSLRVAFNRDDLPVLTVQLPGLDREAWPEFRASQAAVTDEAGVEIVVTLDVGDPTDVHPREKRTVGERLARLALQSVYARPVGGRPPRFDRATREREGWMTLVVVEAGAGLRAPPGFAPAAFHLAGADRVFRPATAVDINGDGNGVRVRCAAIAAPVAVRYAWEADPPPGLVRIDDDMPVMPFRTDDWPSIRVACVGDSITQGIGLHVTYPAALSRLAGPLFDVRNFGRSGTTVQTNIERSGWMRGFALNVEHARAQAFAPDIVIFNLGINDLSPGVFDRLRFEREYEALIRTYQAMPSAPAVWVWTPLAPLFPGQRFHGSEQLDEINGAIATVAERTGATTIDMFAPLREHGEWFPDHLHPNDAGAAAIARHTCAALARMGVPVARTEEALQ
jgi:sialate O-acetylesterase